MVKSMTGYGKAEVVLETGKIILEIRSLNGKNAEIGIKTYLIPKDKEIEVRKLIAEELYRGNIDLFMSFEANTADSIKKINMDLAMEYYQQLSSLGDMIGAPNLCKENPNELISTILRMPEVMDAKKQELITDDNWPLIEEGLKHALEDINNFRATEGEVLYNDVKSRVNKILDYSSEIEQCEAERLDSVRERILSRFSELQLEPDQSRLEQEMIYHIERLDLNEERVRLRQHCNYFIETLDNDPQPGKKLGFLTQEMGREINTTGSKANHSEIQKIVVQMKDELEKIKEQSLNIL